ncbi:tomoregulin-2a isoform X2 [Rhinoraja longicauda]
MVESHPPGWTLAIPPHFLLAMLTLCTTLPVHSSAYPTSLSDCQTPTGWNCSGFDDREHDLFLCDVNTCQFGGECLRIGETITCDCQLKCSTDYMPVCGSNGNTYQNECYLRQAACKQQSEIKTLGEGSCSNDMGSGSGDGGNEGSGETTLKKTSSCDICQFGAECDVDAEDVWCVCNIDCSGISFNPVCASDGKSYDNPCQVKEASCQDQNFIEVKHLGRCPENVTVGTKAEDGLFARTDYTENANKLENPAQGLFVPCPNLFDDHCLHGKCEYLINKQEPSCSCDAGFKGPRCEQKEFNVLKCPRGNRIQRQKQNATHYSSDNTTRASTRLI